MDPIPKVGKLPEIRETLLKRRKEASALRAQRVSERQKNQVRDKEHKKTVFKRIESYIKQSRRQTNDLKRAKRVVSRPAVHGHASLVNCRQSSEATI
jgi:hypothetical protein